MWTFVILFFVVTILLYIALLITAFYFGFIGSKKFGLMIPFVIAIALFGGVFMFVSARMDIIKEIFLLGGIFIACSGGIISGANLKDQENKNNK